MSTATEHLMKLVEAANAADPLVTLDWSGITASTPANGRVFTADLSTPDIVAASQLAQGATKLLNFIDSVAGTTIQATITLGGNISGTKAIPDLTRQLRESRANNSAFFTNFVMEKIHQSPPVSTVQPNGLATPSTDPIIISGSLAYQYEVPLLSPAKHEELEKKAKKRDDGDGNVWVDLYPTQISAVPDFSTAGPALTHQHTQLPRKLPVGLLNDLQIPIVQGIATVSADAIHTTEQDISNMLFPALQRRQASKKAHKENPRGVNINLSGSDILTAVGIVASFLLAFSRGESRSNAPKQGMLGISYGFNFFEQ